MAGFLDEALALTSSRSTPRRREIVCIFPDNCPDFTSFMDCSLPMKTSVRSTIQTPRADTRIKSPKAQAARPRTTKSLASTRKAPLRQNSNPPQPGAIMFDIPGRGSGKENIPPGMSGNFSVKSKPIGLSPVYRTTHQTERKNASAKSSQMRPRNTREKPAIRTAIGEVRGNNSIVPKPRLQTSVAPQSQASSWTDVRAFLQSNRDFQSSYIATTVIELVRQYWMFKGNIECKRRPGRSALISFFKGPCAPSTSLTIESAAPAPTALSSWVLHTPRHEQFAVVIQRAWRSYMEHLKESQSAMAANVRIKWATGVIARWWCRVRSSQKRQKTPRRKPAARRSAGHQSRGRVGIRRL